MQPIIPVPLCCVLFISLSPKILKPFQHVLLSRWSSHSLLRPLMFPIKDFAYLLKCLLLVSAHFSSLLRYAQILVVSSKIYCFLLSFCHLQIGQNLYFLTPQSSYKSVEHSKAWERALWYTSQQLKPHNTHLDMELLRHTPCVSLCDQLSIRLATSRMGVLI